MANSLKPANIESVEYDESRNRALLVVRDEELALAIGKNGLNAKLATELTGVQIDIISESQLAERVRKAKQELTRIPSLREAWIDSLLSQGIIKLEDVIAAGVDELTKVEDLDVEAARRILEEARLLLEGKELQTSQAEDQSPEEAEADVLQPAEATNPSEESPAI